VPTVILPKFTDAGETDNCPGPVLVILAVAVNRFAPQIAWIVLEPALKLVPRPVLLIVATAGFEELQLTVLVTSAELPSL
jgi:type III secretory pathway component EscT